VSQENRGHAKKRYNSAKSNKKQASPAEVNKSKQICGKLYNNTTVVKKQTPNQEAWNRFQVTGLKAQDSQRASEHTRSLLETCDLNPGTC